VFPSEAGTSLEPRNVERVWQRAKKQGVRLRVYAHAMPGEESDPSFADFGGSEGTERHQAPPLRVVA